MVKVFGFVFFFMKEREEGVGKGWVEGEGGGREDWLLQ